MASTREITEAIAAVSAALRELPLDTLPEIASITVRGFMPPPLRVELQQGGRFGPADLTAWANELPDATAAASWGSGYIRVEVVGRLTDVPVVVWDHIRDELTTVAEVLGLGANQEDRAPVAVPVGALEQLGGQGVLCDA